MRYNVGQVEALAPQHQENIDLMISYKMFAHGMRKHGYRKTEPHRYLACQRDLNKERGHTVHEFFHADWPCVEDAMEQAVRLGKMKPWHILSYKFDNVVGGSDDYPRIVRRDLGMLIFTREADWLMFKMCL